MKGRELLKIGETKLSFRRKDGKLMRMYRIVNISDDEVEYTTAHIFSSKKNKIFDNIIKKIKISEIVEVIKK